MQYHHPTQVIAKSTPAFGKFKTSCRYSVSRCSPLSLQSALSQFMHQGCELGCSAL